jgi:hypothetical protein
METMSYDAESTVMPSPALPNTLMNSTKGSIVYLISLSLSLWITCKISLWLIGVLGYFSRTYNRKIKLFFNILLPK